MKNSSKINKIRTVALSLIFIGFFVMYLGVFARKIPILMTILMVVGFLCIILSVAVYFWIGMLSTKIQQVVCPSCKKHTKMLGRVDFCMYCKAALTTDENLDGKQFDIKYNRRTKKI